MPVEPISSKMLEHYYGIHVYEEWNLRTSLGILKQNLIKGYPVVLNIDPKHCNWIKQSHNVPFNHFILVTELNDNSFKCFDCLKSETVLNLSLAELIKGFHVIYYFDVFKAETFDPIELIKDHVSSLDLSTNFNNFYDALYNYDNIDYKNSTDFLDILEYILSNIAGKRELYSEFLSKIKRNVKSNGYRQSLLQSASEDFMAFKLDWLTLRNTIIKSNHDNKFTLYKDKILCQIKNIQMKELEIQNNLNKL